MESFLGLVPLLTDLELGRSSDRVLECGDTSAHSKISQPTLAGSWKVSNALQTCSLTLNLGELNNAR